jgi:hypothetical protein
MAFRESYAGLAEAVVLTPGITKAWSVKDVIAHVTTWEEEALKHLPAILDGQKPPRYSVVYGGIDAFNALMTANKAKLSLAEVLEQQEQVHRRVVKVVEHVPEDALVPDSRFRRRLRLDTYGHYPGRLSALMPTLFLRFEAYVVVFKTEQPAQARSVYVTCVFVRPELEKTSHNRRPVPYCR